MSESEEQNTENTKTKKKKSPVALIFLILMIIIGIGVINNARKKKPEVSENYTTAAIQASEENEMSQNTHESETENDFTAIMDENSKAAQLVETSFNVQEAAQPRILGNPNAPIRISEHSSFTCGHCATFHEGNFKKIKADYIDTGKAYIVFDDFPRNLYDMHVGAVARCVNEDVYFNFVQLLFETQKDWLNEGYLFYLKQNAKLTGATEEQIDNCLNSTDLHEKMANSRDKVMEDHDVKSTPTLVINNSIVVRGLSPYEEIKKILDAELEKTDK